MKSAGDENIIFHLAGFVIKKVGQTGWSARMREEKDL